MAPPFSLISFSASSMLSSMERHRSRLPEVEAAVFGVTGSREKFGFSCVDIEFLVSEEEVVSFVLFLGFHTKDVHIDGKTCLKILRGDYDVVDVLVFHGCIL